MALKDKKEFRDLPEKKQKYMIQRLKHLGKKTKGDCLVAAGYSENSRTSINQIETEDYKQIFAQEIRKRIPASLLTRRMKEGLNATYTTFYAKDGIVTDSRDSIDYGERRQYTQLAAQMGGYWNPKQEVEQVQRVDERTMSRMIEIAEKLDLNRDARDEANTAYDRAVGPIIEVKTESDGKE